MGSGRKLCIEYFYDVVSPYAYIGYNVLLRYRPIWQNKLILRPVLLGGILKESGNIPPPTVPNKFQYVKQDLTRRSDVWDVPLQMPPNFPSRTLTPMRLLTVVEQQSNNNQQQLEALTGVLFEKIFVENADLNDPQVLQESCRQLPNVSDTTVAEWIESSASPKIKQLLVTSTADAVNRGAFGVPTMFVTPDSDVPIHSKGEMVFGSYQFETIARQYGLAYHGPKP